MSNDKVIEFIKAESALRQEVKRVWLYGSRAKSQATEQSDYDIAVDWTTQELGQWGEFVTQLRENNPTLNQLDIVQFNEASDKLKKRIRDEGRVIYEKD